MANISSALNYALAGLSVSAAQSALVARNVNGAADENYTRKTAEIQTLPGGTPMVSAFNRSTDRQLLDKLLTSGSDAAGKQVVVDALIRMGDLAGDPDDGRSIAAGLGALQRTLRSYESDPSNPVVAQSVLEAARSLADGISSTSDEVTRIRTDSDDVMAGSVERINSLLAQFKVVNDSVVRGQGTAGELAETLDQRDSILKQLSEELSIRTTVRPNNDVLIYAEGGAVLFESSPRAVRFTATQPLVPGMTGNAVLIDGVAVTGDGAPMPLSGGKLAAHAHVRDNIAPQLSRQLDQIAAGLVRSFAEMDPALNPTLPDVEGLFTADGLPLPDASNPPAGLAARLAINALVDPRQGGSLMLLREGGFGGVSYVRNTLSQAGYQSRIAELADAIDSVQNFGQAAGIGGTVSLKSLSIQSSAWVDATRQAAQKSLDLAAAVRSRASDSLSRVTGVNIDQEMAALLDLEKSYQASSKVLATIDAMLAALLEAVR
jgi:flagellar hook-associated protein 1 FlgK